MKFSLSFKSSRIPLSAMLPFLFVLVSVLLIWFVALPTYTRIGVDRSRKATAEAELASAQARTARIRQMTAASSLLREHDQLFTRVLPDELQIPQLLDQILKIAQAEGVVLGGLQYGGSTSAGAGTLGTITIPATIRGTYAQVISYLKAVESASRYLDVLDVNLSGGEGQIAVSLPLRAYYLLPPPSAGFQQEILIDINSPEYSSLVNTLKSYTYYDTTVPITGIGKTDPFIEGLPPELSSGAGQDAAQ